MPHKQKENHDHSAKGKKERQRQKQDADARKQAKLAAAAALAEEEKLLLGGNSIPMVEGHGNYEIGCEPEREYNFNIKKRSKKHLRNDLRMKEEREEKEREEEQSQRAEAQAKLAREENDDDDDEEEEEEEEVIVEEYMVYICECCDKRYATKNQFLNHSNSNKHKSLVRIYEELGVIVTHVELRGENGNDKEAYDDYEEDAQSWDDDNAFTQHEHTQEEADENDEDSDEEYAQPPRGNLFAAFDDDSSSSSASSEDSDDEDEKQPPPKPAMPIVGEETSNDLQEDDIDLDELIHQNKLIQEQIDTENNANATIAVIPEPLPFDGNYDPNDYGVNENRLAAVQHRLQKRLAERGIVSSQGTTPSDAIAVGRTLLQEVLDANIETLQNKLEAYNRHKKDCQLLGREFARMRGNTKALSAQYVFRQDTADNTRSRANVHHAGSHYHMQAARSMQFGRSKGLTARHSSQGARLQASRTAATEASRMQSGGGRMKVGKSSKKSSVKRQGQAGGSKKTGGNKGDGE